MSDDAREWIRAVAFGHPRSYETRLAVTVQEVMHTNLLPVLGTPNGLYTAQWTKKEDYSWIDGAISIDKASQCWTLHDLTHISSPLRDHIDIATVRAVLWTGAVGPGYGPGDTAGEP